MTPPDSVTSSSSPEARCCLEVVRSGPRHGETCQRRATYTNGFRDLCSQHANALVGYGGRFEPITTDPSGVDDGT